MNQGQNELHYSYTKWRTGFLRTTMIVVCVAGLAALIPAVLASQPVYQTVYVSLYLVVLLFTVLPVSDNLKAGILVFLVYILAVSGLTETGIRGDGRVFMLGAITIASLVFSWRAGWLMAGIAVVTYMLFGYLTLNGRLAISETSLPPEDLETWLTATTGMFLIAVIFVNAARLLQKEYESSESRAWEFFAELNKERKLLESRVQERTSILDKRTAQFRAVADVGKSITSYNNLEELLQQSANLIHENFDYYHVGIFLLDERKEFAVLAATNSEGGKRMLEKGHLLKVGETGIVGYVAANLRARIALDVGEDAAFFNNPDLPNTRSELALPLVASGQILGVLDVQSTESRAFVEDDIATLQILAEQIAVAIQNANLFSETAKALESTRATYGQLSREAWSKMLRNQAGIAFLATPPTTVQITGDTPAPGIAKAFETGDLILGSDGLTISVPVKIRGQVIGALRLKKAEIAEAWTQEETNLAISLSDQLSGALESARLYRDSLQRASRESLVSDISARINASSTRSAILRETVLELGQALGNASVTFQLLTPPDSDGQAGDGVGAAPLPSKEEQGGGI